MADDKRNNHTLEPGARVLIVGDHPWAGHAGEFVVTEIMHVLGTPGLRIRLDNGWECFVMEPRHLRRIDVTTTSVSVRMNWSKKR